MRTAEKSGLGLGPTRSGSIDHQAVDRCMLFDVKRINPELVHYMGSVLRAQTVAGTYLGMIRVV